MDGGYRLYRQPAFQGIDSQTVSAKTALVSKDLLKWKICGK
jgi:hypothetical protein